MSSLPSITMSLLVATLASACTPSPEALCARLKKLDPEHDEGQCLGTASGYFASDRDYYDCVVNCVDSAEPKDGSLASVILSPSARAQEAAQEAMPPEDSKTIARRKAMEAFHACERVCRRFAKTPADPADRK
jgi:hypothetical protein